LRTEKVAKTTEGVTKALEYFYADHILQNEVVKNDLLTVLVPKNGVFNTNLGKKLQ
jgi:hypothetical protein